MQLSIFIEDVRKASHQSASRIDTGHKLVIESW